MWRRLLVAAVLIAGCEHERATERRPQPRRDASPTADAVAFPNRVHYAARTDNAADGSNTTFFNIIEDEVLFIVADGEPDVSKDIAEHMGELSEGDCSAQVDEEKLRCIVTRAHTRLTERKQAASAGIVMLRSDELYVARTGDAVLHWRHAERWTLDVLAEVSPRLGSDGWTYRAATLTLRPGDSLLLTNGNIHVVAEPQAVAAALASAVGTKDQMKLALSPLASHVLERALPTQSFTMIAVHIPLAQR